MLHVGAALQCLIADVPPSGYYPSHIACDTFRLGRLRHIPGGPVRCGGAEGAETCPETCRENLPGTLRENLREKLRETNVVVKP